MFGNKHDDDDAKAATTGAAEDPALRAEFDRVSSLSLAQLAAEVMAKTFGPGGPGADDSQVSVGGANISSGIEVPAAAACFIEPQRDYVRAPNDALWGQFVRVIAEGFQALEHASLIRAQMHTAQNGLDFATTRLGRQALEAGTVDRILSGRSH